MARIGLYSKISPELSSTRAQRLMNRSMPNIVEKALKDDQNRKLR